MLTIKTALFFASSKGWPAGQPLEEAKKSAVFIVNKMRSIDRISIVVYDNNTNVVVPSQKVINKASIIEMIRSIHEGGATDLHSGWLANQPLWRSVAPPS